MKPKYDIDKLKFGVGDPVYSRAVGLYVDNKINNFKEDVSGFSATVDGTHRYYINVSAKDYNYGNCDCYLGQREELCKHMVAVSIYAIKNGKRLSEEDKVVVNSPKCSKVPGELAQIELSNTKKTITAAIRYIKAYTGPSKTWFAYQNSLDEGCARLSKLFSDLPVSKQTAKLVVDTLLRLDKKICEGGVDDSNGTVGGLIEETVVVLQSFAELDPNCNNAFKVLKNKETSFGWEEPLVESLGI